MNSRIAHKKYVLSFDVWEPLTKQVERELDAVIKFTKQALSHAGDVHILPVED